LQWISLILLAGHSETLPGDFRAIAGHCSSPAGTGSLHRRPGTEPRSRQTNGISDPSLSERFGPASGTPGAPTPLTSPPKLPSALSCAHAAHREVLLLARDPSLNAVPATPSR